MSEDSRATPLANLSMADRFNFLITNRIPRRCLTLFMGWFSRLENPLICRLSLYLWQLFVDDLRLYEAERQEFRSMHDCFTRRLKAGTRPVDSEPKVLVSPCDAIVGEFGRIDDEQVFQAKGFPYTLTELVGESALANAYRDGWFVTLRLKSSMYHRFHAPQDGRVENIHYISGDTWNVNPVSLKCIEKLFCKNERIVMELKAAQPEQSIMLVPVAAILVASMRVHGLPEPLNLRYRGANTIPCELQFKKGEEMGYFEHGSTIILFSRQAHRFVDTLSTGSTIRMGEPLMLKS